MKILLLGEYSNVHATLAEGLRTLGHQVTVASNGDFWKDYPRDIDLTRHEGPLGGLRLSAKVLSCLPRWRGYDVVQLINPMFLEMKAERILPIFKYLRRHNRKVVLCAMGMDYYWVSECTNYKPLRYSDFNIGDQLRTDECAVREQRDWLGTAKETLNRYIATHCDHIVAGLYEDYVCYQPHFREKLSFIPLPIKMPANSLHPSCVPSVASEQSSSAPVTLHQSPFTLHPSPFTKIFIGISRGRSAYKGTDIMLRAAEDVLKAHPDKMQLIKVEGVPFAEYQRLMDGSDAILDQLYSYTPSMNPLLAMSKGIICIGGGEPESYDILGETELRPIINVEPTYDSVRNALEDLILHPERIPDLKRQSIDYVRRHHDHLKVARQYETLYKQ